VRRDSSVWTTGEFDDGITSVAAPVVDANDTTIAALHCHGPSYRFPGATGADTIAARVIAGAAELSASIRFGARRLPRGAQA
jgi:DNA-binding IclR family transcriptional regulator